MFIFQWKWKFWKGLKLYKKYALYSNSGVTIDWSHFVYEMRIKRCFKNTQTWENKPQKVSKSISTTLLKLMKNTDFFL